MSFEQPSPGIEKLLRLQPQSIVIERGEPEISNNIFSIPDVPNDHYNHKKDCFLTM